jgi:hypothetical protein
MNVECPICRHPQRLLLEGEAMRDTLNPIADGGVFGFTRAQILAHYNSNECMPPPEQPDTGLRTPGDPCIAQPARPRANEPRR